METPVISFDDADNLVKAFFRAHEKVSAPAGTVEPPALNAKGFGAAQVGEGEIFFEYHPDTKALECSALVYRFRNPPRPGILDGFKDELTRGTDAGGGEVDFEPENGGLFLTKLYADRPDALSFVEEVNALTRASVVWAKDVVPRVAQRVIHGKG